MQSNDALEFRDGEVPLKGHINIRTHFDKNTYFEQKLTCFILILGKLTILKKGIPFFKKKTISNGFFEN